jgi:carbamoyl-phosphate synthase large subunit
VVTKIPRFAFEKFPAADNRLTTQMKSVGEVMAIGRTFQESFQKALRGLEVGVDGMNEKTQDREILEKELGEPGPERIWYVGDAFAAGWSLDEVHDSPRSTSGSWCRSKRSSRSNSSWTSCRTRARRLARWMRRPCAPSSKRASPTAAWPSCCTPPTRPCAKRAGLNVRPVYKRVDTCAAEFATNTAYMYSTYDEECEAAPTDKKKIMVLGGGPNRIGQGIEFDYCCVHAALAMREDGYETIMVNCNPETVSTDYDTSDRLYFEPLTLEDVLEIVDKEKPAGVIVQYGGQTPLKLALGLEAEGVPIIGTTPDMIDAAEDRERFQKLLQNWACASRPTPPPAPKPRRWKRPPAWATRWWCAPATCWAAARWKSCTSSATWSATCAKP